MDADFIRAGLEPARCRPYLAPGRDDLAIVQTASRCPAPSRASAQVGQERREVARTGTTVYLPDGTAPDGRATGPARPWRGREAPGRGRRGRAYPWRDLVREWDSTANAPLRQNKIKATYDKTVGWICPDKRAHPR